MGDELQSARITTTALIRFERVAQRITVTRQYVNALEVEVFEDQLRDTIDGAFTTFLATGAPAEVAVSLDVPQDWRHAVLEALADNTTGKSVTPWAKRVGYWLADRVRYTTVTERRTVNRNVCPHIANPGGRSCYEFAVGYEPDYRQYIKNPGR